MKEILPKEKEVAEKIHKRFNREVKIQNEKRIWISIEKDELMEFLKWLKQEGFVHLSAISVSDWLAEKQFKIDYLLWSYLDKIMIILNVRIDRENPVIDSIVPIWGDNAQAHEREVWEFFGINFEGNKHLIPLFTDEWQGPPPFRKDFDWHKYVRENYYSENNERERGYYYDE